MNDFLYCLNTSTIEPTPLLEKIRIAGRIGYDAVELWNREISEFEEHSSLGELKRIIADAGLRVASMIALEGWTTADGDARTRALDECRHRMDQAAALGSPIIVASQPKEAIETAKAAEHYAELLRLGRRHGVKPALEFLGFVEGINTLQSAWSIAQATRDPDAAIVADVYHLLRGGGSLDDLLTLPSDKLAIFHFNDLPATPKFTKQTDFDRVMPGDGVVDLKHVIANLRQVGYQGMLSLELFNKTLWAHDPEEVARKGLERMQTIAQA
jgi:sugar phosphate isomerase/epimerase